MRESRQRHGRHQQADPQYSEQPKPRYHRDVAATDALTLPFSWYSDEELLRRERSLIFARSWQYGGRADQVAAPGSYLATDAGGVPILVVRDAEGELRAFLNVCRHRGAVLTEGCGTRETIQCHYHAWTYDLDGSLRAAPRSDREPGFDKADWPLLPASVDTWGPFLFVNPSASAGAARRAPRRPARDPRARHRPVGARVPLAGRARLRRELEDRRRELPRVLPLRDGAPRLQQ